MVWPFSRKDQEPVTEKKSSLSGLGGFGSGIFDDTWSFALRGSVSGPAITHETAFGATSVLACVRVIAEGIAQMPLSIQKLDDDGNKTVLKYHPAAKTLCYRPSRWLSPFDFRQLMIVHAVLTGAGRAIISRRGRDGGLLELTPVPPSMVRTELGDDGECVYHIRMSDAQERTYQRNDIFEIRGPGWEAHYGWDITRLAREAIGLALSTEETHSRFHANSVRPSGILTVPGEIDPEHIAEIKKAWNDTGGTRNAMGTQILTGGVDWKPLSMTGVDAQHLETRRYQVEEICRAFRIFPVVVGHADKTSTFASVEQFFHAHVTHSLMPWVERFENAIATSFLSIEEQMEGVRAELDTSALQRGSDATRAAFYNAGAMGGWLTRNEIRRREGLNRIDGLDEPTLPMNVGGADNEPDGIDTGDDIE